MESTATSSPNTSARTETTAVAAGLLLSDRGLLIPLLLLVGVPGLIEASLPWVSDEETFIFAAFRQVVGLVAAGIIGARWVHRLRREPRPTRTLAFAGAVGSGFGLWLLFSIPPLIPLLDPRAEARFFGIVIAVPAVIIAWRYLLLPATYLLGVHGLRSQLTFARNLTREDPLLPLRIILPPVALKFLLIAVLYAFSPDGRAGAVVFGAAFVGGIVPILVAYLSIASLTTKLSDRVWSDLGLDPYRTARITTIVVQGRGWLARLLKFRTAFIILTLGALVAVGNALRLAATPPPVDLAISAITLADDRITVTTQVTDPANRFRGFRPIAFFLATERGFPIARRPRDAEITGDRRDVRLRFPREGEHAELNVTFQTDRPALDMQKLEDIYLWYGGNKLQKLDLKGARMAPPVGSSPESALPAPSPE
ncbi:MAG: hypothetical protein RL417_1649 [Pseudomonadota bacterium]|jgi:hypothetical protein